MPQRAGESNAGSQLLPQPHPDLPPREAASRSILTLGPPLTARLTGDQSLVGCSSHTSVADAHILLKPKSRYVRAKTCMFWSLNFSLNPAFQEPSHSVPCFPFLQIQYLLKFKNVNKHVCCEMISTFKLINLSSHLFAFFSENTSNTFS